MTVPATVGWPALTTRSMAPIRATVARLIFERAVAPLPVRVTYPDGRVLGSGAPGIAGTRRSCARPRSSPGWAAMRRSGSVRPTWPGTGGPGPAPTWPTC